MGTTELRLIAAAWALVCATQLLPAEDALLSESQKKSGWRSLLSGDSLEGWSRFRQPGKSDGWSIDNGVLTRNAESKADLITVDGFDNFELSLEYQLSPGASSGILFHVDEQADRAGDGAPEIELIDSGAEGVKEKSGYLKGLYSPGKRWPDGKVPVDGERPVGHWNQLQVLITGSVCSVNLNGIGYYQFNLGSDEWKKRVAESPFARFANFAAMEKGPIGLQTGAGEVRFRNMIIRELPPDAVAKDPIDGLLPIQVEPAFPDLKWADWQPVDEDGRNEPFRPIVITHAGDGSGRLFVAEQRGRIYGFKNDQRATSSKVFLDLRKKVRYADNENEEGLLGLAFHPRYKETGELFAYYTDAATPHLSVISRFRVSKDNPDEADPASEEVLMRIPQPYWNHNGGTLAFGPDGFLYVGMGDGGSANDPGGNGQNLATLLGSILRIDVDHRSGDLPYAIPADNPFKDRSDARPETFAYGFRNVWRLAFDRETGLLWAADVGQNLWEEINIVRNGGNYGWSFREGLHPFGPQEPDPGIELIDPVWEYDHQVGKSITGGCVYRGQRVPELVGKYLYADYVTGKIWALAYDSAAERVRGNYRIESPMLPIITFGDDEQGEVYFAIVAANGKGLYRFVPK